MIDTFSPYPFVDHAGNICDGLLFRAGNTCRNCNRKECQEGFSVDRGRCLYGYNYARIEDGHGVSIVLMGFLLKGTKYPKNYKTILSDGFELGKESIDRVSSIFCQGGPVHEKLLDYERKTDSRILHDLKHLLSALERVAQKREIEEAVRNYSPENWGILREASDKVYKIVSAIKNQISLADFIIAPDITKFSSIIETNIDGVFKGNIDIYNVLAIPAEKFIEPIRRNPGVIDATRRVNETFVLLPAILLENALKHSTGRNIQVEVRLIDDILSICVKSYGPIVPEAMRGQIWKLGQQYTHKNSTKKGGSGFGLYLAKKICADSNFDISYDGQYIREENGVPVGFNSFVVAERQPVPMRRPEKPRTRWWGSG
jgi:hypothetical protein